jgi:hypothetical protein
MAGLANNIMIPIMIPVFSAMDPSALPNATSDSPFRDAVKDTKVSGMVVHILTIVAPMMIYGILNTVATQITESINQSLPLIIMTKPRINNTK